MLPSKKKVSVVGFCSGLGQKREGLEKGPAVLRSAGLLASLASNSVEVDDRGDLFPEEGEPWGILARLRESNFQCLKEGILPLTLGGDHSLAIATIQATLSHDPTTRVVWVDAHGDMNTPETSPSGNLHGMPLAVLMGLFESPLKGTGPLLSPEDLLMIGVRDLDGPEKEFVSRLKIQVISSDDIKNSADDSLRRIAEWLSKKPDQPLHLSLDVDAIDPEFAPSTGLPVDHGMDMVFATQVMKKIRETGCLAALDFVELNPLMAKSDLDLHKTIDCAKILLQESLSNREIKEICSEKVFDPLCG